MTRLMLCFVTGVIMVVWGYVSITTKTVAPINSDAVAILGIFAGLKYGQRRIEDKS